MQVNAYLNFNGQCEEAFQFYAKVLGGRIEGNFRYSGTPMAGQVPAEWQDKIMHTALILNNGGTVLGADVPPGHFQPAQGFSMSLVMPDAQQAERIFHALAEGGNVMMPIQQTFWSPRFGLLTDRFGIPWMINCEAAK